jgi:hypothetical protein
MLNLSDFHLWAHLLKQQSSITISFADLRKQTSIFRFCLQKTKGSFPFFRFQHTNRSCCFSLVLFSLCSSVSTEVDFWNSAEVGIFSELVLNSAEFRVQDSAEYWGMALVKEGGGLGG